MPATIKLLKDMAKAVFDAIHPIIGTKKGAEKLQKGAGGDVTMVIDDIAEKIVIKKLLDILPIYQGSFSRRRDGHGSSLVVII